MRVLIVRLSSMGDLVQTLPALTDAASAIPSIKFDWAVDEGFVQIPSWHRNVETVFPTAFRRWGRKGIAARTEVAAFRRKLREKPYDAIIDVQGEWKSATVAFLARGKRLGYDRSSVHEWGAHLLYQSRFNVPKGQHSMQRMRQLLAEALGYSFDQNTVDYGIDRSRLIDYSTNGASPFSVLIHSTSWSSKNWPESHWLKLRQTITSAGYHVVLPWGTDEERERALRIAGDDSNATVLPALSISEKASIISRAAFTVGLDTGLSHIAAALDVPSVSIYGATDPKLVGAMGRDQLHVVSKFECLGCHEVTCSYPQPTQVRPACFGEITPEVVWTSVQEVITR